MDLVGPRYIKDDGRFYSLNIIDVANHHVGIYPMRTKSAQSILESLSDFWSVYGMPDCLQMDNELSFRGSNRHPRSFGLIVRFALHCRVTPLFIPFSEPWRNGVIESFNNLYDKRFFRIQTFNNFEDLGIKSKEFERFHNLNHRYSSQQSKTPAQLIKRDGQLSKLKKETLDRMPLESGSVLYIRFIRSDLKLMILDSTFTVSKNLMYSYVECEVNIDNQALIVRRDYKIFHVFTFITNVDW